MVDHDASPIPTPRVSLDDEKAFVSAPEKKTITERRFEVVYRHIPTLEFIHQMAAPEDIPALKALIYKLGSMGRSLYEHGFDAKNMQLFTQVNEQQINAFDFSNNTFTHYTIVDNEFGTVARKVTSIGVNESGVYVGGIKKGQQLTFAAQGVSDNPGRGWASEPLSEDDMKYLDVLNRYREAIMLAKQQEKDSSKSDPHMLGHIASLLSI
jgi:hypothetical protein